MSFTQILAAADAAPAPKSVEINAPAQEAPRTTEVVGVQQPVTNPAPQPSVFGGMLPFIIVFAVMIFFMFRSQKKQQQKRQQMLDQIVKGSRVILGSGIYGTVVEVREKTFVVEIADKVQIEVLKGGVSEVAVDAADGKDSKDK